LTLIVTGSGRRYVGDSIEQFGPGDFVLLAGDLPHTWHVPKSDGPLTSIVAQFDMRIVEATELSRVRSLLGRSDVGLRFGGKAVQSLAKQFEQLPDEPALQRLCGLFTVLDRLSRCRDVQMLSSAPYGTSLRTHDRTRIDRVCRFIESHVSEPITQAQIARQLNMGQASFSRFFRRMTGRTFTEHMHHLRVGETCRMLVETDEPITQIAFAVGFNNIANFNRIFRRLKGMSPREFRNAFSQ